MANVTVTFQVLNVTEPVLAYHVIQSIRRTEITLEQALGYKVLVLLVPHCALTQNYKWVRAN